MLRIESISRGIGYTVYRFSQCLHWVAFFFSVRFWNCVCMCVLWVYGCVFVCSLCIVVVVYCCSYYSSNFHCICKLYRSRLFRYACTYRYFPPYTSWLASPAAIVKTFLECVWALFPAALDICEYVLLIFTKEKKITFKCLEEFRGAF